MATNHPGGPHWLRSLRAQDGNRSTLAALVWDSIAVLTVPAQRHYRAEEDSFVMTTKTTEAYVARYLAVDTHLNERNGSTKQVYGIAGERPAGRKLADDIAKYCNQLDADGYDVVSIFPLTSGRAAEVSAEAGEAVIGRTYRTTLSEGEEESDYVDTGVGYSVTDGVIVVAGRRARRRQLRN